MLGYTFKVPLLPLSMLSPPSSSQALYSMRPPFMLKETAAIDADLRLILSALVAHAGNQGNQRGKVPTIQVELSDFFSTDRAGESED